MGAALRALAREGNVRVGREARPTFNSGADGGESLPPDEGVGEGPGTVAAGDGIEAGECSEDGDEEAVEMRTSGCRESPPPDEDVGEGPGTVAAGDGIEAGECSGDGDEEAVEMRTCGRSTNISGKAFRKVTPGAKPLTVSRTSTTRSGARSAHSEVAYWRRASRAELSKVINSPSV